MRAFTLSLDRNNNGKHYPRGTFEEHFNNKNERQFFLCCFISFIFFFASKLQHIVYSDLLHHIQTHESVLDINVNEP